MNNELFYISLFQLGVSIFIGVLILYSTYRLIDKFIRTKNNIQNDNFSYAILCSSILFSVAYLISDIKDPILDSIRLVQNQPGFDGNIIFEGIKYTGFFLCISIIIISLVIIISIYLFTLMTKDINEFEEIKNNNVAVSIITSVIIISISMMVKDSLYLMLESFLPYPTSLNIY